MNPTSGSPSHHASASGTEFLVGRNAWTVMSEKDRTGTAQRRLRLLVPINANEDSRWGVTYALRLHDEGRDVEVCFLNVGEIITQWQVLRFRTQTEIAKFQAERAEAFIEEASQPLAAKGIACRGFFKQGSIVFLILDTAEELECDEIVMPLPPTGLLSVFSRDIVTSVLRRQRGVQLTMVDRNGAATKTQLRH